MQQVVHIVPQLFEIAGQLRRPVDVAVHDVEHRDAVPSQRLLARPARDFVVVGADDDQGMPVQVAPARGARLDDGIQVRQQGAVAAAHVADAAWLKSQRPVEDLHDDLVDFLEIGRVRPTAAPHVHRAVHQRLEAVLVDPRDAGIPEQQRIQHHEERQVRDRHAVRARDLHGVPAARSQFDAVFPEAHPALSSQ